MSNPPALKQVFENLLDKTEVVSLLQGAVAQNSITGNEANFVGYLQTEMTRLGLAPKTAEFLPGRPNIWGEFKGTGDGKRLLFIGHTDTVHAEGWREKWENATRESPFGGAIIDGEIWGRGTGDLKAGICSSLAAFNLIQQAGLTLKGDISFAFVGDEESGEDGTGISAGIKDFVARTLAGEIDKPDFAVYVEPTKLDVYAAQMGFFIADIKITGKSAYFGVPEEGIDALKATHKALAAIWQHSDEIGARAEHPLVGRAFALVTQIKGGGYIAVPGECSFSLIRKLLPGESLDLAVSALEKTVTEAVLAPGIDVTFSYPAGRDHSHGGSGSEVDQTSREIDLLTKAVQSAVSDKGFERKRGQIEGAPYWSEAPFLINSLGCPTVYCAPGDITNCHTLEERVCVDEYLAGIVAFALFITSYCGVVKT